MPQAAPPLPPLWATSVQVMLARVRTRSHRLPPSSVRQIWPVEVATTHVSTSGMARPVTVAGELMGSGT